jgi:uncharacterized protein YijF (DUF1287 family)
MGLIARGTGGRQGADASRATRTMVVARRAAVALTTTAPDGSRVPAKPVARRVSSERHASLPLLVLPLLALMGVSPWLLPTAPSDTMSVASSTPPAVEARAPRPPGFDAPPAPPLEVALPVDRDPTTPARETAADNARPPPEALRDVGRPEGAPEDVRVKTSALAILPPSRVTTPTHETSPPLAVCPAVGGPLASRDVSLPSPPNPADFGLTLARAARDQLGQLVIYDPKYRSIRYPMGDVGPLYGVCTDVVIRAYRRLGIDLQVLVALAKLGRGDPSIDHRRVEVLRRFFAKAGAALPITDFAEDYAPGDIVTYRRPQNRVSQTHIAIVTDLVAPSGRPMVVHNRGWGPLLEDALFADQITGHYRYQGEPRAAPGGSTVASDKEGPRGPRATEAPPAETGHATSVPASIRSVDATPTVTHR